MKTTQNLLLILSFCFLSFAAQAQFLDSLFILGPQEVCVGECTEYFIEGANPDSPYEWILSDGSSLPNFNSFAIICWNEPGVFTIFAEPLLDSVIVFPLDVFVSDFGALDISSISNVECDDPGGGQNSDPCENVCAYTTVTYSVEISNPNATDVEWNVVGAESFTIDGSEITVEWGGPGQGLIEVFDFGFCTSFGSLCVDILENPVAEFTATPAENNGVINICEGQTVFFENLSTGASRYTWLYDVLGSSDNVDGEFTFQTPGTYEVSLIAQNECFCADTTSVTVEVEDALPPIIDCVGTVCPGEEVTYTTTASCGNYDWNIIGNGTITDGGGTADDFITITWNAGPVGWIELTVTGCTGTVCAETMIERIPILDGTAEIKGPTEVCYSEVATYTIEKYDGASYVWNVEWPGTFVSSFTESETDVLWGGSPSFANNPLTLTVEYENCYLECSGMATLDVFLLNEFYVEGPVEVCQNSTTTYTGQNVYFGPTAGWNWMVEDATGAVVWNSAAASTNTDIDWNYPVGTYTLLVSPAVPTDYCDDLYEVVVNIVEPPAQPDAVVGENMICPGIPYRYDAQTVTLNNDFVWYIQDGATFTTLTGNPVTYSWGATPPYSISAAQIATSGFPCESDTTSLDIFPLGVPVMTGNPTVCDEATEIYSATFFENVNYNWTINPTNAGTVISGQGSNQVEVQWNSPGNANISVDVCAENANMNVQVNPLPDPMPMHPVGLCPGEVATVTTSTSYTTYSWRDENGGQLSTAANPSLGPGYYEIVVTDAFGCEGNNSFFIEAFEDPVITISTPDDTGHCLPEPFPTLYALETDGGYDYQWFRDGIPVGTNSSTIVATVYGIYTLVVTNAQGCTATSNAVDVFEFCDPFPGGVCNGSTSGLPATDCEPGTNISFTWSTSAFCNTVNFQNTCFDYQVGSLVWTIVEGAGVISTDPNPTYTFARAGYYTVILEGTNNLGQYCWDADVVLVPAAADFSMAETCAGDMAQFSDLSTYVPTANITNWDWDFGDPTSGANNTSTDQYPEHLYTDAGNYTVTLTITDQSGCISTYQEEVTIHPLPVINFTQPVINCEATSMLFEAQVSADVITVEWDFGDPSSGDANFATSENSYHTYETAGAYTVTLTAYNVFGCEQIFTENITVESNGLAGTITPSGPLAFCEGEDVDLTAPAGGISWLWSTGEITETINTFEEDVYSVTVTDVEGCEYAPPSVTTDVIPLPSATVAAVELNEYNQPVDLIYDSYSVCEGTDVNLQIVGDAPYQYSWPTGDVGVSTQYAEWRGNQLGVGTYNIDVDVLDPSTGCTNVASFEIVVHPNPVDVNISASNLPLCENNPATLSVDSPDPMLTYVWNTGEVGTSISVFSAGEYFVKAINSNGCSTLSDLLEVEAGPDIAKIPSGCLTRCNPDTICLPDFPIGTTFQWFLDGTAIAGPEGTIAEYIATESGTYHVEMVGPTGCTSISDDLVLDLYIGVGLIDGEVYFDLNDNGIVDAGDTLMNGVIIELVEGGSVVGSSTTNGGLYSFNNILALDYTVMLDPSSLPPNTAITVDEASLSLIGCDDEESFVFLVSPDCPPSSSTVNLSACTGETASYNGTNVPAGTTQNFNFTNSIGCDSTVTVIVAELTEDELELEFSACAGEAVEYNGTMVMAGDEVDFTFQNIAGCDSVVTVVVEEVATSQTALTLIGCDGTTVNYNGTSLPVGSVTDFAFTNYLGCDSTVTVTVNSQSSTLTEVNLEACAGETITFNGVEYPTGTLQTFDYIDQFGCDSTVVLQVLAYPEIVFELASEKSCWNSSEGVIEVLNVQGNTAPVSFALEQNGIYQPENVFTDLPAGLYTVFVQDEYGCEYAQDIQIEETQRIEVELEDVVFPCDGDQVTVNPFFTQGSINDVDFLWSDGSSEFFLDVSEPGLYWVDITSECEVIRREVTIDWDTDTRQDFIYVPNAFSPNNDGINDIFQGFASGDIEVVSYELLVFDRWGDLMFKTENIDDGWDGWMRAERLNTEVFVYYINAVVISCGRPREIFKKGDVTLID